MKVKHNGRAVFQEISIGDVFRFNGRAYMRVTADRSNGTNAIQLEGGTSAAFLLDDPVERMNGAFVEGAT